MNERWDTRSLMAMPVNAKKYKSGVMVKRTTVGLSWYAYYRVPIAHGARKTKTHYEHIPQANCRADAESVYKLRCSEVFTHTYAPKKEFSTVAEFFPRFCELKSDLRTLYKYKWQFEQRLLKEFGKKPLDAVTPGDVEAYYKRRLIQGASLSTARSEIAALRSFYSAAQRDKKASTNPAKLIRTKDPNNARDRLLSDAETAQLFALAESREDYVRPLFFALYFTGRRISEVVELRWSDIEFAHGRIAFTDAKRDNSSHAPLHPRLREELIRWREFLGVGEQTDDVLFPSDRIPHLRQPHSLRLLLKSVASDITPHTLRHNLVSQLQRKGVPVNVIAQYTGHKTLTMLYRYSHANTEIVSESLNAMPVPGRHQADSHRPNGAPNGTYRHSPKQGKLIKLTTNTR